jgi:hypothetical protein
MTGRKSRRPENDTLLRRARRLIAQAAREFGAPSSGVLAKPRGPSVPIRSLPAERRRRIVGLVAELDLAIKAMRQRRDELGRKAGLAFRNRNAVSAYHRSSLLLRPDKHARR